MRGLASFLTFVLVHFTETGNYTCEFCGKQYKYYTPYQEHVALHAPISEYCCRAAPLQAGTRALGGTRLPGQASLLGILPLELWDCSGQDTDPELGTVKLSWDLLSQGHC